DYFCAIGHVSGGLF
nr:immunoglobulin light chain junction region [Macaca mulatta]MOV96211.1 immunoglobulin light chain junction region [Macaca mulatta]MOV96624.1 immunoglobulin light chain junction region [Macaca mulatta]MOW00056.1 immunoglobulin light chain junction region [Macaca mulatta]MOW00078.1 immunoglobulin light chain junction region [Macaca mulatta]